MKLACVVYELESRGEDLKSIKIGLLPLLRKIAEGVLLPGIVVLYASTPKYLSKLATMPVIDQKAILEKGYVEPPKPPKKKNSRSSESWERSGVIDVKGLSAKGSPRDVGEMAAEMVMECTNPVMAITSMVHKLDSKSKQLIRHILK